MIRKVRSDCGKPKLSLEEVETRLAALGFSLVGSHTTTSQTCALRCSMGHEWDADLGNVLKKNGTGCPHCAGRARLTLADVERRLAPRGIRMLGYDPRSSRKAEFECVHGHIWTARLGSVLEKTGCPECGPRRPLTRDEVNARISSRGYQLSGEFFSAGTRAEFECSEGHTWLAIPDNILRGRGCPQCAKYGFNPKYPAYFYTIHILSKDADYVGFGITKDVDTRFSYHARAIERKGFNHKLLDIYSFDSGYDAKALEDIVKENFPIVDTGIDGFHTEAIDGGLYPRLVEMMNGLIT